MNNKFANVSEVNINDSIFYDVYLQTNERFLFEAIEMDKKIVGLKPYPLWSSAGKNRGGPGECYFIGSSKNHQKQCRQYTECNANDEGGEGGCEFKYYFDDGEIIGFSGVEESYGVIGGDFYFGFNDILKSYKKTCYPYDDLGKIFCYQMTGTKLEPLVSVSQHIWESINDNKRHLIYGTDGLNYGSQVVIEEWRDNELAWKLDATVTCSNGAVICYLLVPNASGLSGGVIVKSGV